MRMKASIQSCVFLPIIDAAEDAVVQFEQAEARHRRSFAVHVLFKRRRP